MFFVAILFCNFNLLHLDRRHRMIHGFVLSLLNDCNFNLLHLDRRHRMIHGFVLSLLNDWNSLGCRLSRLRSRLLFSLLLDYSLLPSFTGFGGFLLSIWSRLIHFWFHFRLRLSFFFLDQMSADRCRFSVFFLFSLYLWLWFARLSFLWCATTH